MNKKIFVAYLTVLFTFSYCSEKDNDQLARNKLIGILTVLADQQKAQEKHHSPQESQRILETISLASKKKPEFTRSSKEQYHLYVSFEDLGRGAPRFGIGNTKHEIALKKLIVSEVPSEKNQVNQHLQFQDNVTAQVTFRKLFYNNYSAEVFTSKEDVEKLIPYLKQSSLEDSDEEV